MAVLNQQWPTLVDVASAYGDDGRPLKVANILSQLNNVLDDMPIFPANYGPRQYVGAQVTGIPKGTYRLLNQGVPPEKATMARIMFSPAMLETYQEVDKALADQTGNAGEWMGMQDKRFWEGLSQTMSQGIFYGNQLVNPERFTGLSPYYNTVNSANALSANYVLDAGGTGTQNTSIWLVLWSENTVFGFYPNGSQAGLQQSFLGERTLYDANGGRYQGYRTHYKWDIGLVLLDYRSCVRICNIDTTKLRTRVDTVANPPPAGPADLIELMSDAISRIPNMNMGRACFYMNRAARAALWRQIRNQFNVRLTIEEAAGKRFESYENVPIRIVDQLLNTEARVV